MNEVDPKLRKLLDRLATQDEMFLWIEALAAQLEGV